MIVILTIVEITLPIFIDYEKYNHVHLLYTIFDFIITYMIKYFIFVRRINIIACFVHKAISLISLRIVFYSFSLHWH